MNAFKGREAYSLNEVARLLTKTPEHRELVLLDLKQALKDGRLDPILEDGSLEKMSFNLARRGFGVKPAEEFSDELRVHPDQLREFLPEAGYPLPVWLVDKPT